MALPQFIRERLRFPVVCAPMFLLSSPGLVIEAMKAGLVGAFPSINARDEQEFEQWLAQIQRETSAWTDATGRLPGPLAVNIPPSEDLAETQRLLALCSEYGANIIITSVGNPSEITRMAHDLGLLVHHDVTTMGFAEKAIEAGVDGLNCIGAGGGGHSGLISHLVLIPKLRAMFDGTIALAGAVASGAAVRAAEVLGADLAFIGTRFAASVEAFGPDQYKTDLLMDRAEDLVYTAKVNGVPAQWMKSSLDRHGVDYSLASPSPPRGTDHLPPDVSPWRDLWSAGQGIELINEILPVMDIVEQLQAEYDEATTIPAWPTEALSTPHVRNSRT